VRQQQKFNRVLTSDIQTSFSHFCCLPASLRAFGPPTSGPTGGVSHCLCSLEGLNCARGTADPDVSTSYSVGKEALTRPADGESDRFC